ncbi:MAG: hypothetical protein HY225_01855 [Candidatus Vogelbacteria bacterium]|nr:hypothetical protein [Candidatus Vogelbacteria bacterium]
MTTLAAKFRDIAKKNKEELNEKYRLAKEEATEKDFNRLLGELIEDIETASAQGKTALLKIIDLDSSYCITICGKLEAALKEYGFRAYFESRRSILDRNDKSILSYLRGYNFSVRWD